jgi:hypothetical protein
MAALKRSLGQADEQPTLAAVPAARKAKATKSAPAKAPEKAPRQRAS